MTPVITSHAGVERAREEAVTEQEFVARHMARDAALAAPRLLPPAIQTNIRVGRFPPAKANGVRYLMIPVKVKGAEKVV